MKQKKTKKKTQMGMLKHTVGDKKTIPPKLSKKKKNKNIPKILLYFLIQCFSPLKL